MRIRTVRQELAIKYPWKIARSEGVTSATTIRLSIEHEGVIGYGEAAPSVYYYGEDLDRVEQVAKDAEPVLGQDPFLLEDIIDELAEQFPEAPAARAALDAGLHDLVGKLLDVPVYKLWGLNPANTPKTSYTLGIDTIPMMLKKLNEAREYPVLKIKVGVPGDMEMIKAIRENTDATIRVDANTGWRVEEAIEKIHELAAYDIEFVEQPIASGDYEGLRKVRENVPLPIMADEDSITCAELPRLAGCVDAINIKLAKSGGLREAMRMINVARALGMKIMIGCMSESSLGVTAAAHLTPLTDYADLDMNLLLTNDPFDGIKVIDGKIILPERPGHGAILR